MEELEGSVPGLDEGQRMTGYFVGASAGSKEQTLWRRHEGRRRAHLPTEYTELDAALVGG